MLSWNHRGVGLLNFLRLAMARYRDLNARMGQVFESLSLGKDGDAGEGFASSTMELKNVMSQFMEMQKRIDSAVTKPVHSDSGSLFGEKTLEEVYSSLENVRFYRDSRRPKAR